MTKKNKLSYSKIYMVLGLILVLFAFYNSYQLSVVNDLIDEKSGELKEEMKPSKIQLFTITDNSCTDCMDVSSLVESVKSANVEVTEEKNLDLSSGKDLLSKYSIERLPTVIVTGELDKLTLNGLEKVDDAYLLTAVTAPYVDVATGDVKGLVKAVIINDPTCDVCSDLNLVLNELENSGITVASRNVYERTSEEAKALLEQYSLDTLPALILSKEFSVYDAQLVAAWGQIGTVEEDGSYVTRKVSLPYVDLVTNEIQGLVDFTLLEDETCTTCYDAESFHKNVLLSMGIAFGKDRKLDASTDEAKAYIEKYSIEKLPTIVLEGDMEEYPILKTAWQDVGSIEDDGSYVFRRVEIPSQPYMDLIKNEVVTPAPPQGASA